MKITKITTALALLFIAGSLTMVSCKKKTVESTPTTTDDEQSTANDNNISENTASDIESMGGQASENFSLTTYKPSNGLEYSSIDAAPCALVTGDLTTRTYTIDFGTSCVGADGRTRSGKLFFDYSASTATNPVFYRTPGFKVNITSSNYVLDGHQVNIINKTISNITPNTTGALLTWSISANITITKANNGGTISWNCNRTKVLVNTADTNCFRGQNKPIIWSKAKVKLNGVASGTNAKGESYTATATDLVRDFTCAPDPARPHRHPFVSGTINYVPVNRLPRLINYGNGNCDFEAIVTINGKDYAFNLN